jgi:hypothetical protein
MVEQPILTLFVKVGILGGLPAVRLDLWLEEFQHGGDGVVPCFCGGAGGDGVFVVEAGENAGFAHGVDLGGDGAEF